MGIISRQFGFGVELKMSVKQCGTIKKLEKELGWVGDHTRLEGFAERTCGEKQWKGFNKWLASDLITGLIVFKRTFKL